MLAGMLSVLLVAGVIGLGVFLATDEPSAAPDTAATTAPRSQRGRRVRHADAVGRAGAAAGEEQDAAGRRQGRRLHASRTRPTRASSTSSASSPRPTTTPTRQLPGTHFPTWYPDGVYAPGTTPELGQLVHALEHGRIEIQYKPGTSAETVGRLQKLYDELDGGYHILLFENATKMPYEIAATAWGHLLGCPKMNDQVFDALRAFRKNYVDKGPETVP